MFQNADYTGYQNCLFKYLPFGENIKTLVDEIETWDGYDKFIEGLKEFAENYQGRVLKVYEANGPDGYNVLNHGDHHMKNIMLKRVDEKLVDICMVSHWNL